MAADAKHTPGPLGITRFTAEDENSVMTRWVIRRQDERAKRAASR